MRGGLRSRLVLDSARIAIIAALEDLGWFDATIYDNPPGMRRHQPVHYIAKPATWDSEVVLNSFAVTSEDVSDDDIGLGGDIEDTTRCYIDLFAQDDQFGMHLAADMRDILCGKLPSIGRSGPFVDVYDFRAATPFAFTTVEVADVRIDRAANTTHPWQDYWYMVRYDLIDEYAEEHEGASPFTNWSEDLLPAWQRIQATQ